MKKLLIKKIVLLLCIGILTVNPAQSSDLDRQDEAVISGFRDTELPLPRFVSLRSDKVYVRAGPALRYPIKWVYQRADMPVEIIQEFESWRKVRDIDHDEGWIHKSLLSGERTVVIVGGGTEGELIPMHEGFSHESRRIARLEPHVVAHLDKCIALWCFVAVDGYRGWVERKSLWGIYEDEELD